MLSGLFTLIGVGFFIKLIFMSAERIKYKEQNNDIYNKNKFIAVHIILGLLFIIIGRFII